MNKNVAPLERMNEKRGWGNGVIKKKRGTRICLEKPTFRMFLFFREGGEGFQREKTGRGNKLSLTKKGRQGATGDINKAHPGEGQEGPTPWEPGERHLEKEKS